MSDGREYQPPEFINNGEQLFELTAQLIGEFIVFVVDDPKVERWLAENVPGLDGETDTVGMLHEFAKTRKNTRVWRKRIWERLKHSVFAGIKAPENKSPGYKTGLMMGICLSAASLMLKKILIDPDLRNLLDQTADTAEQAKPSEMIQSIFKQIEEWVNLYLLSFAAQDSDDAHDFMEGFTKGKKSFFLPGRNNPLARHTTASEYLLMMLVVGKELERMDTVSDMYDYLKHFMKNHFMIVPESFRDLCNRIGLQGRSYRRKERNSISKRRTGHE